METIHQIDKSDCFFAAIAMLTEFSYDYVAKHAPVGHTQAYTWIEFLLNHHFAAIWLPSCDRPPIGVRYIAGVIERVSGYAHVVVVDEVGALHDPDEANTRKTLDDMLGPMQGLNKQTGEIVGINNEVVFYLVANRILHPNAAEGDNMANLSKTNHTA